MLLNGIWEYSAHPELKAVAHRLDSRFGSRLRVLPSSPEWLTIQVTGLTDENLIRTLEREQIALFGMQMLNFQVVCKSDGRERGVSIKYLPGGGLSGDPGFWYY